VVASATRPAAALPPAAVWHTIGMVRCACALPRCRSGFSCKSATSCCARRRLCRSAVEAAEINRRAFVRVFVVWRCGAGERCGGRTHRVAVLNCSPAVRLHAACCTLSVARCMLYVVGCTRSGRTQTALARHSTHAKHAPWTRVQNLLLSASEETSKLFETQQRHLEAQPPCAAACVDGGLCGCVHGRSRVRMRHWAATQEIRRWEEDQRRLAREKETLTQQVRRAYNSVLLLVDRAPCRYIYIYIYIYRSRPSTANDAQSKAARRAKPMRRATRAKHAAQPRGPRVRLS
jgi:hypothetical protein